MLKNQISQYIGEDPDELLEELRTLGESRAELSAKVEMFDHRRKHVFAQNMVACRYDGDKRYTDSECEAKALTMPNYVKLLADHASALVEFNKQDAEYWRLKSKFDYLMNLIRFAQVERKV